MVLWLWILWSFILPSIYCQSSAHYRTLNRKLNLVKKGLESEISDLEYDIYDLRTEVELLSLGDNVSLDNGDRIGDHFSSVSELDIDDLKSRSNEQGRRLNTLSNNFNKLQKSFDEIKETVEEIQENQSERNNKDLKQQLKKELLGELKNVFEEKCEAKVIALTENFLTTTSVLKRAFKEMKEEMGGTRDDMPERLDKIAELIDSKVMDTNKTIVQINLRVDSIEAMVHDIQESDKRFNKTVELLKYDVNETKDKCSSLEEAMKATPIPIPATRRQTVADITTAQPEDAITTRKYRGYLILNLDGEEITNHIDIGSRVIQGKDWPYGDEGGGGPGTVDSWYGGSRLHKQVMVTWDDVNSRRLNYWVGAHSELYILAEGQ